MRLKPQMMMQTVTLWIKRLNMICINVCMKHLKLKLKAENR